ncbi:hypothetical protein HBH98_129890 [Parastagonospora nodorum]|nr:hypothetical protein HBH48_149700 [Parastagonospora nodorum]KAH4126801.1 hypothetical protein HBH47_046890 [Parastagonospora nodorum]KAH4155346.1 hypothetical protein HBH43_215270 [Parastagonospora nodorum]KAH4259287.1 hypothetical protein HBI04_215100 [Parastagonospora nodorum]KAH4288090.1 hypothetical protein HBI01_224990 [Parastagonospora nodorum]
MKDIFALQELALTNRVADTRFLMRGMDLPRIAICSVLLVVTTTQLYAFSDSRQRYPGDGPQVSRMPVLRLGLNHTDL